MVHCSFEQECHLAEGFDENSSERALTELYNSYFPRIYNYVHYRVNDYHDADDLVSQIFLKTFSRLRFYKPEVGTFSVWIYTIARNTIIDYFRHNGHTQFVSLDLSEHTDDFLPQPVDLATRNETRAYIRYALSLLSQREREIVALKFWSGCSNRTIAKLVGLSESNIGVILFRAMRRLRTILEQQGMTIDG